MAQEQPFRFLTDAEFKVLSVKERAEYLMRAAQELEDKQRLLRQQLQTFSPSVKAATS
jgi:hypothetical protein